MGKLAGQNCRPMTVEQIHELADNLDCGLRCFIHRETRTLITIPDSAFELGNDSTEFWNESIKEVENNFDNYVVIEKMNSNESFRLMQNFTETIEDELFRDKLDNALSRPKPFKNFKLEIDNSEPYRQRWFDFKKRQTIKWIKEQLTVNDL
jgi:hypothetical protein